MDCGRSGASAPNRTADIQCRSFLQFLQKVLPEFGDFRPDYERAVGLRRISPEVFLMVILRVVELRSRPYFGHDRMLVDLGRAHARNVLLRGWLLLGGVIEDR